MNLGSSTRTHSDGAMAASPQQSISSLPPKWQQMINVKKDILKTLYSIIHTKGYPLKLWTSLHIFHVSYIYIYFVCIVTYRQKISGCPKHVSKIKAPFCSVTPIYAYIPAVWIMNLFTTCLGYNKWLLLYYTNVTVKVSFNTKTANEYMKNYTHVQYL